MTPEQKQRFLSITKKYLLAFAIGFGYYLFVKLTNWGIPCIFYKMTGMLCPGCGVSRMLISLIQLDFVTAAKYNLLLFCLLPFGIFLLIWKSVSYVKNGTGEITKMEKIIYVIAFVLAVVFTVLRNLGTIPFLQLP